MHKVNINSKKFLYNLEFVWCEYEDDVNDVMIAMSYL